MTTSSPAPSAQQLPDPTASYNYFQTLRPVRPRWWRSLLGLLVIGGGYVGLSVGLSLLASFADRAAGRTDGLSSGSFTLTPMLLLSVNLSAAALIPLSLLVERLLYRRSGRLHSVEGPPRGPWLRRVALIIVPLFAGYAVLAGLAVVRPGSELAPEWTAWLAVVLLTTPLQAAGEEYGFRGAVGRIVGSWFAPGWLAVTAGTVASAAVFAAAHGSLDPWLLAYYAVFGVMMSVVTWQTGGLEAAVVVHVSNNVVLGVVGALTSDMSTAFDRSVGTGGPFMLVPMVAIVGLGVLIIAVARRRRVTRLAALRTG
ncbi:CPBP family intramembrane glutamic endopeptidase [Georgenia alba]|uniref:CPBP family intramembrane glutamic endopeptidase n=1 Tax=Georgenia alba TaxID=2233858 RepID=A0ABW2QDN8_9MICO